MWGVPRGSYKELCRGRVTTRAITASAPDPAPRKRHQTEHEGPVTGTPASEPQIREAWSVPHKGRQPPRRPHPGWRSQRAALSMLVAQCLGGQRSQWGEKQRQRHRGERVPGVTGGNGGGATRHPQDMILGWGCDGAFQGRDRKESLAGAGGQAPGLRLGGGADR